MTKVLIVGGSSGIGLAAAEQFVEAGHHVTVVSRTVTHKNLKSFCCVDLDFTDPDAVNTFFEVYPGFDYVVVTAMTPLAMGAFLDIETEVASQGFEKFWGIVNVIRAAARHSKNLQAITVVSGAAAEKRGAPLSYIAATHTAINSLVESLSIELAPLRINAISPGLTDTPLYQNVSKEDLQKFASAAPLKRLGTAVEAAAVINFVTLHSGMTGAIIPVDAGSRLI